MEIRNIKLVVLDLDHTTIFFNKEKGDITSRPNLAEFLKFLLRNYDVGVWTAGDEDYAYLIVDEVFQLKRDQFKFIWSREDCQELIKIKKKYVENRKGMVIKHKKIFVKPLAMIWKTNLAKTRGWNKNNTILIDDTPSSCSQNKENCIMIRGFNGEEDDRELKKIREHLYWTKFEDVLGLSKKAIEKCLARVAKQTRLDPIIVKRVISVKYGVY
jgi:TFIIF-interacting CTD phosphatase-like protein